MTFCSLQKYYSLWIFQFHNAVYIYTGGISFPIMCLQQIMCIQWEFQTCISNITFFEHKVCNWKFDLKIQLNWFLAIFMESEHKERRDSTKGKPQKLFCWLCITNLFEMHAPCYSVLLVANSKAKFKQTLYLPSLKKKSLNFQIVY